MNKRSYTVLGINHGGHDTSAALMIDGVLVAACEQERYDLQKHSRAFPNAAIADCLAQASITWNAVDEIAFAFDPIHHIREVYLRSALADSARIGFMINDIERIRETYETEAIVRRETGFDGPIQLYNHHRSHLASAYYPSGFKDALLLSIDGVGEVETGMWATGRDGEINVFDDGMRYPHSLGLFYSALTFYLGWKHHCDEGIIMGLAPFGDPNAEVPGQNRSYLDIFRGIIVETGSLSYEIDLDWVAYHRERDVWVSDLFKETFGQPRKYEDPLTDHHKSIAAALQLRLEEVMLGQLEHARKKTGLDRLCIAGGVGLNCSMNGKIAASGIFKEIFVQPASGDSGVAAGACWLAHKRQDPAMKPAQAHNFYLGHGASDSQIEKTFEDNGLAVRRMDKVAAFTADRLQEGLIIGWYQGRAEFGPRALGNRSILTRPYPEAARDHLNERVKFREMFRPFAPAVMIEHLYEYFDISQESPHMLIACQAQPEKAPAIAATVHVDGSCRVQSVCPELNARFYDLLSAFNDRTGCPVLLNTSFNVKGQPIVNTPEQAVQCFLSTNIDVLVVGDYVAEKPRAS